MRFSEITDFLDRLDVRFLELWPHNVEGQDLSAVRRELATRKIQVSCVSATSTHRLNREPTEDAQRAIFESIALARELNAPYVTTYMGSNPAHDTETMKRLYARDLEPCLRDAARHGITILLENMFDSRGEDPQGTNLSRRPEGMRAVVEVVSSPNFGVTYDPCNFHIAGVEPYPYAYELLKDYIRNVHIKDAAKYTDVAHGDLKAHAHWVDSLTGCWLSFPVGQGAINFYGLLNRLLLDGYSGCLTIDIMTLPRGRESSYVQSVEFIRAVLERAV
jgi:sugar phosphate isomerase/epimerase